MGKTCSLCFTLEVLNGYFFFSYLTIKCRDSQCIHEEEPSSRRGVEEHTGLKRMGKTGIVYSQRYLLHKTGEDHPESPARLRSIMRGIDRSHILEDERCVLIEPRAASLGELSQVHSSKYVEMIREFCRRGGGLLDEETGTTVSPESFETARLAAGGAIQAAQMVMRGELRNAFVISRPPGHHACRDVASGFCIFNNVALAAKSLMDVFSLKRILIFDLDAHHGDGTQRIFYDTDKVLYISLHEDPSEFPGTGFIHEVGEGKGLGYTVNIPLPFGTTDSAYWKAIKSIVMPIIRQYRPEFILISAGFDGYFRDSLSELSLSAYIYLSIFQVMMDFAHLFCEDRIVAVLEGGYYLRFLKKMIPAIISRMAGLESKIRDDRPFLSLEVQKMAEKIIKEVEETHSKFWKLRA